LDKMSAFRLEAHKAVKKDLRKIPKKAAGEVVNKVFPKIVLHPSLGISLTGDLKGYFKYVLHFEGMSYRIIYQIDQRRKVVFIIAVGVREKFYERLLRRIS
jgi:mRNA-degrading endonuclease RelE of RelBE toxin-antitoxin system